jgi:hypothetical protein
LKGGAGGALSRLCLGLGVGCDNWPHVQRLHTTPRF